MAMQWEWGASDLELAHKIAATLPPKAKGRLSKGIVIGGAPLDLCKLFREVQRRGGYTEVGSRDQWGDVAEALGFVGSSSGAVQKLSTRATLAAAYARYLREIERQESRDEPEQQAAASRGRGFALPSGRGRPPAGGDRLLAAQEAGRLLMSVSAVPFGGGPGLSDEIRAINTLTRITESADFELLLESVPDLLEAVGASLDRHNAMIKPFRRRLARQLASDRRGSSLAAAVFASAACGKRDGAPPGLLSSRCLPASSTLEEQLVCGNIILLQNLSYIVGNQELIAYHAGILAHLVSVLPLWHKTDLGLYACTALANISKHLDVNGMPMPEDDSGVPEESLMALAPVKMRTQASSNARDPHSQDFVTIVYNIFPILFDLIINQEHGSCLFRCLDFLSKLMQTNEDNGQVAARYAPSGLFVRLHELFYVPLTGLDSLPRPEVTTKSTSRQAARYNFEDWARSCDVALLDLSVEVAVNLAAFHETHAKLAAVPGFVRSLVNLFGMNLKGDILARAALLIRTLATEEKGMREIETLRGQLNHLAFRSEAAASLVWHMFVLPPAEDEDLEGEEEEGSS